MYRKVLVLSEEMIKKIFYEQGDDVYITNIARDHNSGSLLITFSTNEPRKGFYKITSCGFVPVDELR